MEGGKKYWAKTISIPEEVSCVGELKTENIKISNKFY